MRKTERDRQKVIETDRESQRDNKTQRQTVYRSEGIEKKRKEQARHTDKNHFKKTYK